MTDLSSLMDQLRTTADQRISEFDCCNWHISPRSQDGSECDFAQADHFRLRGDPPVAMFNNSWPLAEIHGLRALALCLRALGDRAFFEITLRAGDTPIIATDIEELTGRILGRQRPAFSGKPENLIELGRLLDQSASRHGTLKLHEETSQSDETIIILDMPET
jgi:hypothetical protein